MTPAIRISVTSTTNDRVQILKHHLTATEKKILIHMINSGLNEGQVRNKSFHIQRTENCNADITIVTREYSEMLRKDELISRKLKIKYS